MSETEDRIIALLDRWQARELARDTGHGSSTARDIAQAVGIPKRDCRPILEVMAEEGRIKKEVVSNGHFWRSIKPLPWEPGGSWPKDSPRGPRPPKPPERGQHERQVRVDPDRLYGPLDGAIDYLREIQAKHPIATLAEHWTGYEDMRLVFSWFEPETDEEFEARVAAEESRSQAAEASRTKEAGRDAARKQIADLKAKHGL